MHRNRTWLVNSTETVLRTQRNRILPEGQEVDISQIGLVDQLSDLTPGLIPAGMPLQINIHAVFKNAQQVGEYLEEALC